MTIPRFAIALFFFALGMLAVQVAQASPVFDNGTVRVELLNEDCEDSLSALMLAMAEPNLPSRKAKVVYQGKNDAGCWVITGDRVIIADETSAMGFIYLSEFK